MCILRSALIVTTTLLTTVLSAADIDFNSTLIFDDFDNAWTDPPNRSYLGAAKGYVEEGQVYSGSWGYWWTYTDDTYVLSGSGDTLTEDNMEEMVEDGAMHVKFKVEQSEEEYPGAEIGCNLFGEKDYLDLSKMTSVTVKAKGTGKVRISFQSKNIKDAGDWGYCGFLVTLTSAWKVTTVPVADLEPAPYSKSEDNVTWAQSKTGIFGFTVKTESSKDAELYLDSIVFNGMKYSDLIDPTSTLPSPIVRSAKAPSITFSNTAITYSLTVPRNVSFEIFDIKGTCVNRFSDNCQTTGIRTVAIPQSLSNGNYLVKMTAGNQTNSYPFFIVK
ncbi:MAG: T9SS type A sorting domain-containing protein [Chitinispirillaceae bacterium]|nr:T9SS type A sorting domain-containing protein [Chitinispirillaceae bacterium]